MKKFGSTKNNCREIRPFSIHGVCPSILRASDVPIKLCTIGFFRFAHEIARLLSIASLWPRSGLIDAGISVRGRVLHTQRTRYGMAASPPSPLRPVRLQRSPRHPKTGTVGILYPSMENRPPPPVGNRRRSGCGICPPEMGSARYIGAVGPRTMEVKDRPRS